ncbi:MAG: heme A synthase [Nitrospinota bacterium]
MNLDWNYSGPKLLLGSTVFFIYLLMVMGNLVMTTGAGLACPDWPLCYGSVNPPKEIAIWTEWTHRLLGAVTGLLILFSTVFIWKKAGVALRFFLKVALGFVLAGSLLGGLVVLIEAPLLDSFLRIAVVSSHIFISTIIFTSMILAFYTVKGDGNTDRKLYSLSLFGVIYFQVILGILVRYANATLACPDFPLCQGSLLPPNFAPEVILHYTHRLTALGIFILTLWNLVKNGGSGNRDAYKAYVTFGLVFLQAALGVSIVLTQMFLPFLVFHGIVGFALLGWVAYLGAPYIVSSSDERVVAA